MLSMHSFSSKFGSHDSDVTTSSILSVHKKPNNRRLASEKQFLRSTVPQPNMARVTTVSATKKTHYSRYSAYNFLSHQSLAITLAQEKQDKKIEINRHKSVRQEAI
jgi:hypothetical protein